MILLISNRVFATSDKKCVDFAWVFADFKKSTIANNGGLAWFGLGNAGETRVFGHDPRNLRANNLRQRGCCGLGSVWARGSSRGTKQAVFLYK